jgi:DNA-binding transcriptional ArsR family regulator
MNERQHTTPGIDAETAETYAAWFRALADPTRIQLLRLLATAGQPMTVGEIVEWAPVGQSTVSHHLKILADVRFVLPERRGTSTRYLINRTCLTVFPAAVRAILGEDPTPPATEPGAGHDQ